MEKSYGIWSCEFSPDYTPAACGHTTGKSLAIGYLYADHAGETGLEVSILGERRRAL